MFNLLRIMVESILINHVLHVPFNHNNALLYKCFVANNMRQRNMCRLFCRGWSKDGDWEDGRMGRGRGGRTGTGGRTGEEGRGKKDGVEGRKDGKGGGGVSTGREGEGKGGVQGERTGGGEEGAGKG